ncbi:MAG: hypothetical protein A2Y33_14490 [Spirochaetes bacterium GWF1_51_8]|nr:MAG: hypothetical protein A2Y33_14490 [Spirochaetes bacterium GWF1_51_8]
MPDSHKIAVIGTTDTIMPFRAIGAQGYEASDAKTAESILDDLLQGQFGIIYIEEAFANEFSDRIMRLNNTHRNVSITSVPGSKGGTGVSMAKIRTLVKRAIGIDIFGEKEKAK